MRIPRRSAPALAAATVLALAPVTAGAEAPAVFERIAGSAADRAAVRAPSGELLARVDDHVVHLESGQVTRLVLALPGADDEERQVLLAVARFQRDAEGGLVLPMSAEDLERLPDFDPERIDELPPGEGPEDAAPGAVVRHRLASAIVGAKVHGEDEPFGAVRSLLFLPEAWTVVFALVEPAGVPDPDGPLPAGLRAIVPWAALAPRAGPAGELEVARSRRDLREAPRIEAPGPTANLAPEEIHRIHDWWGVEPPPPGPLRPE